MNRLEIKSLERERQLCWIPQQKLALTIAEEFLCCEERENDITNFSYSAESQEHYLYIELQSAVKARANDYNKNIDLHMI